METIAESGLEADSWCLINSDKPGKEEPKYVAMSNYVDGDIVIMIDADALIPKGSFETFRNLCPMKKLVPSQPRNQSAPKTPCLNTKRVLTN